MSVTTMKPLVTVLMAVFNTPSPYLRASINSILSQSYDNFEFLIIDDGSRLVTRFELQNFAATDKRILLHHMDCNVGLTTCLNYGISMARGEFILRHDSDDVSMPSRIELSVEYMYAHPSLAAAASKTLVIGAAGEPIKLLQMDLTQLIKRNVLVHGSTIFRKDCLLRVGGYNEHMLLAQDYELYLRLAFVYRMDILVIPQVLYCLRVHSQSLSRTRLFRQHYYSAVAKTLVMGPSSSYGRALYLIAVYVSDLIAIAARLPLAIKRIAANSQSVR